MQDLFINVADDGTLELDITQMCTTPKNNMILSVVTPRGALFYNPAFGSRHHLITKIGDNSLQLMEAYLLETLQWIIDAGRAISDAVAVTPVDLHRVKVDLSMVQADGREITFSVFKEVA